jgi:hypothetical protein
MAGTSSRAGVGAGKLVQPSIRSHDEAAYFPFPPMVPFLQEIVDRLLQVGDGEYFLALTLPGVGATPIREEGDTPNWRCPLTP